MNFKTTLMLALIFFIFVNGINALAPAGYSETNSHNLLRDRINSIYGKYNNFRRLQELLDLEMQYLLEQESDSYGNALIFYHIAESYHNLLMNPDYGSHKNKNLTNARRYAAKCIGVLNSTKQADISKNIKLIRKSVYILFEVAKESGEYAKAVRELEYYLKGGKEVYEPRMLIELAGLYAGLNDHNKALRVLNSIEKESVTEYLEYSDIIELYEKKIEILCSLERYTDAVESLKKITPYMQETGRGLRYLVNLIQTGGFPANICRIILTNFINNNYMERNFQGFHLLIPVGMDYNYSVNDPRLKNLDKYAKSHNNASMAEFDGVKIEFYRIENLQNDIIIVTLPLKKKPYIVIDNVNTNSYDEIYVAVSKIAVPRTFKTAGAVWRQSLNADVDGINNIIKDTDFNYLSEEDRLKLLRTAARLGNFWGGSDGVYFLEYNLTRKFPEWVLNPSMTRIRMSVFLEIDSSNGRILAMNSKIPLYADASEVPFNTCRLEIERCQ